MASVAYYSPRMRMARGSWAVIVAMPWLGIVLTAASTPSAPGQAAPAATPISFNRDIRPILANNCFACHGPDEKHRETKFHFDTQDGAFAKRGVIVPGKRRREPARSAHHQSRSRRAHAAAGFRARADGPADRTAAPMDRRRGEVGHALGVLAAQAPEPPAVEPAAWVRNPIDQFILARLEREGLKPSPEADKVTLLRRVTST